MHRLDPETFDHVAGPHVLIIFERHAAFLADNDFSRIVLEPLELRQLALMHDDIVAHQPDIGAALDDAFSDTATRNIADL